VGRGGSVAHVVSGVGVAHVHRLNVQSDSQHPTNGQTIFSKKEQNERI